MNLRRWLTTILMIIGACLSVSVVFAQQATVLMNASPSVIMADGRSSTIITATASGLNGEQVPDGTILHFTTTSGSLSAVTVATAGGIVRVTLTSSPVPGYADLTATFIGSAGSGAGDLKVEFTSDKELANSDEGASDWIRVTSSGYLAYSADSELVDASGKQRGVKFSYRGLVIIADALQLDMSSGIVRARNAVLSRGRTEATLRLVAYSIVSGTGEGLSDSVPGSRTVEPISINGKDLSIAPMQRQNFDSTKVVFVDISQSRVIVTASAVEVRMNDKIQLKHASVYVDSKKIVSMPYQIMPLNTNQLFGQQVVGYGSDGLFLDVPYYASVTPKDTSAFYLRSTSAAQQDGTYYSGRQGLALDYVNTYGSFDGRTSGQFNVMGLSRNDWGASWTHTEQFNSKLRGYFYVDSPEHNSFLASADVVQLMRGFSLNMSATQSKSAIVSGYSSSDATVNTYLQTDAHRLGGNQVHGLFYSNSLSMETNEIKTYEPGGQVEESTVTTKSAGLTMFTTPFKLGTSSSLTDSINFSQAEESQTGVTGVTANAVLNLTTKLNRSSSSTFSVNFSHDPVAENTQSSSASPIGVVPVTNQTNYSLSVLLAPKTSKWTSNLMGTYSNPLGSTSLTAGFNYNPTSNWTCGMDESYSQYAGLKYRDLELSIGRRIGSRELEVFWSSIDGRIRFDMGSATF